MQTPKLKSKGVMVTCAVDTLTVQGVNHTNVKGKQIEVPTESVSVLRAHKFIEEGKANEPVSQS